MFMTQHFDVRIQVLAIVGAMVLMVGTVELVRRHKLGERFSLLWLSLGGIILILALFRNLLEILASLVGVYYPPSLIFGALTFMQLGVILYLSVALTKLETRSRIIAQKLALLEQQVQRLGTGERLDSHDASADASR